jgi:hypothetical protein
MGVTNRNPTCKMKGEANINDNYQGRTGEMKIYHSTRREIYGVFFLGKSWES